MVRVGGGLSQDHRRSKGNSSSGQLVEGVSRQMKAKWAQKKEMFTELYVPKMCCVCLAAFLTPLIASTRCAAGHFTSIPAAAPHFASQRMCAHSIFDRSNVELHRAARVRT